jgi:hypothetical protein
MSDKPKALQVDDRAKTLTRLEAQKMQALANGHAKVAHLIQKIINVISKKK